MPKVSRSAIVQWPNDSYQIFWEFETSPAESNADWKGVNVAAVWCEASTSLCLVRNTKLIYIYIYIYIK